jgi:RNA polymerase sigma-70 factor, ECF subfamily
MPNGLKQMDEQELIQAAAKGDLEAFNQLVVIYQDAIYNQARWLMKEQEAAEDMAQEAFIRAYQSLRSYRGGSFRSWLSRIVTNVCLDELRRMKRRPTIPLLPSDPEGEEMDSPRWVADPNMNVEEAVESIELNSTLRQLVEDLPIEYRTALVLVDILEYDYAEAAQGMGIPIGTLKSRLVRARLRLRARLEHQADFIHRRPYAEQFAMN